MMGGELWRSNVIMTSTLLPGAVFALFFVMNLVRGTGWWLSARARNGLCRHASIPPLFQPCSLPPPPQSHPQLLWGEGSSAAVPFGTLVALMMLWFFVSVPLVGRKRAHRVHEGASRSPACPHVPLVLQTFIGAYSGFKKPAMEQVGASLAASLARPSPAAATFFCTSARRA